MSTLRDKSLHELRSIAQGMGVEDIFSKDAAILCQDIELKQAALTPEPVPPIPRPEYDARLMTRPPSRTSSQAELEELLAPHVARGLHLSFPDPEHWCIRHGSKEDTGTMRQPLRIVVGAADKLLK